MYGRYGNDTLNSVLLYIYLALAVVYIFYGSYYLLAAIILLMLITLFRMFSRNISARRKENAAFVGFFASIKRFFVRQGHKIRDRKTHVYRKCPHCHQFLRLKKVKGKHEIRCPKCGKEFNVKIR